MRVSAGLAHADMLECQYSLELHPDPAWCLCSYPSTSWQLKNVYMTSRPGVSILLNTWPALTISMCSTEQKAGPKHVLLLASHPHQTWPGHPCDRDREKPQDGVFSHAVCCACCCGLQSLPMLHLIIILHPLARVSSLNAHLDCSRFV